MNKSHQPRQRFGQHFLTDTHVLQKIMRALALQKTDCVLEIGPGTGALTEYLLDALHHLTAIELDRDLIIDLQEKFSASTSQEGLRTGCESPSLKIISADALSFDYASLSENLRVVGNLPYNISTPLLFKLFSQIHVIDDMHFMLQKEVVLRLTAEVGSSDYGRLSVMSQYFCDNDYLFDVPPTAFDPPPKVDSAMVRLTPKKQPALSPKQFSCFSDTVKEAFNYRRKQISNSLKRFISLDALKTLNIDPSLRPQDLSVTDFIRISQNISVE